MQHRNPKSAGTRKAAICTAALLTLMILLPSSLLRAQTAKEGFEVFANRCDSLMVKAYEQKSPELYQQRLGTFTERYFRLSEEEQKIYSPFLFNAYYNYSCLWSLINRKAEALEYLQKAFDKGYHDYQHTEVDSDLDNLRNEPDFKAIERKMREVGDYLYILKSASKYDTLHTADLPAFSYQPADTPELKALRAAFNLDSIAGTGNQASQMINLMNWIHYLIPHDGNHDNPAIRNAMNLISQCRSEKRGLNCRGLATVLNECYLAMGFPARILTCYPKDSLKTDNDCHVINLVYASQLKKWLWMDPTNNAYIMNEKGELLSVEETRQRIIEGRPLILNPDANWNRKYSPGVNDYLFGYMAKNLYKMESPARSEYDYETKKQGKVREYIQLVPDDNYSKDLSKSSETNTGSQSTLITYKTANPIQFWSAP